MTVQRQDRIAIDVKSENQRRKESGGDAEYVDLFQIGCVVTAPVRRLPAGASQLSQLRNALDERHAEEEKNGEGEQPGRKRNAGGGMAGHNADGVQGGKGKDVQQHFSLEIERVHQSQNEIKRQYGDGGFGQE